MKTENQKDHPRKNMVPPRVVYVDMSSALIQWEDDADQTPQETKEVFCGITQSGEELIRFAKIQKGCLELINHLKTITSKKTQEPKYHIKLISSSPKIYTNAINQCFDLGFSIRDIISAEEFYDSSNPNQIVINAYSFKESSKNILLSLSPLDSSKSKKQRAYLGIDMSRQLTPDDMKGILKRREQKELEKQQRLAAPPDNKSQETLDIT
jgi:hypothetical protein